MSLDNNRPGALDSSRPETSSDDPIARVIGPRFPDEDFVRRVAATCELEDPLEQTAVDVIADGVRAFLYRVIKEAATTAVHCRRFRLISQDIDAALVANKFQPLYGMSCEMGAPLRYAGSAGKETVLREEGELELAPVINAPPPKMPPEPALKTHWLVIDGEQPAVPENPLPETSFDSLMATQCGELPDATAGASTSSPPNKMGANKKAEQQQQSISKTLTTNTLSLEQQVFFKEVTDAVVGDDAELRNEALHCVQTDRGLTSLLPRFSLFITEGVRANVLTRRLDALKRLIMLLGALLKNSSLSLHGCLHDLLPSVVTCVVSRRLSPRPDIDCHWALREHAARLLADISTKYPAGLLRARITRLLARTWTDEQKHSMTSLYASIFALNELGMETIRVVLLPRVARLYEVMRSAMAEEEKSEEEVGEETLEDAEKAMRGREDRKAASKMDQLITAVLINYVRSHRPSGLKEMADYREQFGGFGEGVYRVVATDMPVRSSLSSLQPPTVSRPMLVSQRTPTQMGYGSRIVGSTSNVVYRRQVLPGIAMGGSGTTFRPSYTSGNSQGSSSARPGVPRQYVQTPPQQPPRQPPRQPPFHDYE